MTEQTIDMNTITVEDAYDIGWGSCYDHESGTSTEELDGHGITSLVLREAFMRGWRECVDAFPIG